MLVISFFKKFKNKKNFCKTIFNVFITTDWRQYKPYQKPEKKKLKNEVFSRQKHKTYQYYKNRNKAEYKKVKNIYRNNILMKQPSHSFTLLRLPWNYFITFRITLVLLAYSFQTDFTFEINSSFFSKGVLNLSLYTSVFGWFQ